MNRSKFSRRGRRWKTKRQRAWRRWTRAHGFSFGDYWWTTLPDPRTRQHAEMFVVDDPFWCAPFSATLDGRCPPPLRFVDEPASSVIDALEIEMAAALLHAWPLTNATPDEKLIAFAKLSAEEQLVEMGRAYKALSDLLGPIEQPDWAFKRLPGIPPIEPAISSIKIELPPVDEDEHFREMARRYVPYVMEIARTAEHVVRHAVPPGVSVVTLREPYPAVHELVLVPPKHAGTKLAEILPPSEDPPDARCVMCGHVHMEHDRLETDPMQYRCPDGRSFFARLRLSEPDPEQRCACGEKTPEGEHERGAYCTSEWERAEAERVWNEDGRLIVKCGDSPAVRAAIARLKADPQQPVLILDAPELSVEIDRATMDRALWAETGLANRAAIEAAGGTVQEWTLALPPETDYPDGYIQTAIPDKRCEPVILRPEDLPPGARAAEPEAERITIEGARPCERCGEIKEFDDGEPCGCECPSCGTRYDHADGCPDTMQCECCAEPEA
jgi:hypothetical protein